MMDSDDKGKIFADNLKFYLNLRGLSRKKFAERLSFSYPTVCAWLECKRYPRTEKIEAIAKYLGINKSSLINPHSHAERDIREWSPTKLLPIVGDIRCNPDGCYANEDLQGYLPVDPSFVGNDAFVLITHGDSMIGDGIFDGDLAIVEKNTYIRNGDIVAAIVDGDFGMLKHYKREGDVLVLSSSNPIYEPLVFTKGEIDRVYIAGKVSNTFHKVTSHNRNRL